MAQYILLIYAPTEGGPSPEELEAEMGRWWEYTQALQDAGVMRAGEALQGSETATTVRVRDGQRLTSDGPFAETKELLAGYWLWQVKSLDEAIEWVKRIPNPEPGTESVVEIRPVFETEDFGDAMTPELREQEERLRRQTEASG
jgi:hypothetical protein